MSENRPMALHTEAGALDFVKMLQPMISEHAKTHGPPAPSAWVFLTQEEGQPLQHPRVQQVSISHASMTALRDMLSEAYVLAQRGAAVGAVVLLSGYTLPDSVPVSERLAFRGRIKDHPRAVSSVFLSLEHRSMQQRMGWKCVGDAGWCAMADREMAEMDFTILEKQPVGELVPFPAPSKKNLS